jgi:DnaJ-class molecular chaperone
MADDNDARFICQRCHGSGRVGNNGRDEPCEECEGEGILRVTQRHESKTVRNSIQG